MREQQVVLKYVSRGSVLRRNEDAIAVVNKLFVHSNLTCSDAIQSGKCPQQAGLASAIGSDDRGHLPGLNREVNLECKGLSFKGESRGYRHDDAMGLMNLPLSRISTSTQMTMSSRLNAMAMAGSLSSA